jgi:hypothetical protein
MYRRIEKGTKAGRERERESGGLTHLFPLYIYIYMNVETGVPDWCMRLIRYLSTGCGKMGLGFRV